MTKNLTEGKPLSLILGFSIPVFLGYLFQQLYNAADTIIVSRCIGVEALAAVGSTGSVNFLIIGFVMGLCGGFSIPVAQRFGAGDFPLMRKYVSNAAYLSALASIAMAALTVALCRPLLLLMRTPADIMERAQSYIVIIFAGIPVIFLYNMTSAIMRALGDSKTPVYFLVLSSFLNIALDLLFILALKMDVAGAALATVVSQGVSGVACLFYMRAKFDSLRAKKSERKIDMDCVSRLCAQGVPMGLQYSITAVGSVILAASVNMLGSGAVASCAAGGKVNMFFCAVFDSLGATMATYAGQNTGAKKIDRLWTGARDCMAIAAVYSAAVAAAYFLFGRALVSLFVDSSNARIIDDARMFLLENSSAYIFLAGVNVFRFTIQGMGFSRLSLFSGVFEMAARALMGVFMVPRFGFKLAGFASPLAWVMADIFLVPAFVSCRKALLLQNERKH